MTDWNPELYRKFEDEHTRPARELLARVALDHPGHTYYDLLAADAASVDVWRTAYQHPMDTPAAIVEWVRSTGLRPFIDPLTPDYRDGFLAEYERRIALAYLPRSDRRLLLAFPRLFIVARRRP